MTTKGGSMVETEVLVVGLGAMGSASLFHLAHKGVSPVGIEQFTVGHGFGSSHGSSRAFRTLYEHAVYTHLAEAAIPLWQDLETRAGEQLLRLTGMAVFASEGNPRLEERVRVLDEVNAPYELLTPEAVTERFPGLSPPDGSVTCFTPRAGFLDASRCVCAHVDQARSSGATVREEVQVLEMDLNRDRPEVETSAGRFRCSRLVVTAGPWTSRLLEDLGVPLHVTRQQKFYFQPKHPDLYLPDRLPVYADYETQFYGFPYHGSGIKVADDSLGPDTLPDTVDRSLDVPTRDRLYGWLEDILPGVEASFIEGSTCMYTLTPDRDFLIGCHPRHPNVLIGAGFSGHGFKFSAVVGRILSDLATSGETNYPIDRFRIDRFERPERFKEK